MKTLVIRLDHLGDLLVTTPLVRALALAGHEVDVLTRRELLPVFDSSTYVRQHVALEEIAPDFDRSWWQLARWLRAQRYDAVILAYAKDKRLCFASAFSGARRRIAMWSGFWGRLTFHQCLRSEILTRPRPVSEILLECATALGAAGQGLRPDLFLTDRERMETAAKFPVAFRGRRIVGIHPGTAGNTCNLPSQIYGETARLLLERTDAAVVITGTAAERKLTESWPSQVVASERVWLTFGELTIRQLACVIEKTDVYLCPSTGPLHIASAVGTRTVTPFCPAVPLNAKIWGNVGAPARVIEPPNCPRLAGANRCCDFERQISAEMLCAEIENFLNAQPSVSGTHTV